MALGRITPVRGQIIAFLLSIRTYEVLHSRQVFAILPRVCWCSSMVEHSFIKREDRGSSPRTGINSVLYAEGEVVMVMHQSAQQQNVTIRKRTIRDSQHIFIAFRYSKYESAVEGWRLDYLDHFPTAFCTFEPGHVTTKEGKTIHHYYILWIEPDHYERYQKHARESFIEAQYDNQLLRTVKDLPSRPLIQQPIARAKRPPKVIKTPPVIQDLPPFVVNGNGEKYYFHELTTTRPEPPPEPVIPVEKPRPPREKQRSVCKKTQHKGISRFDCAGFPGQSGYRAQVVWQGKKYSAFFSDAKHHDALAALEAAIQWRNEKEREIGKPRTELAVRGKATSNTGVMGVHRKQRGNIWYLDVTWTDLDGKQHKTSFSEKQFGVKGAMRKAKALRQRKEMERAQSHRGKVF